MSFLAPLFLLGVLAVGMPILFHLIRRTTRERQVFSSLMFLQPTPPRITRQNRLENLLLLLLRCLVIGLLTFAFARPFLQKPTPVDPADASTRQTAVLIDRSASMQREDLWAQAVTQAEAALDQTKPGEIVGLYTFDQRLHPVLSLEESKKLPATERSIRFRQALTTIKPGWGSAALGSALIAVSEGFETGGRDQARDGTGQALHRLWLISDLAEGSHLNGLQGHEWPKGLEIDIRPVVAKKPTNAGIQLLPQLGEEESMTGEANLRCRITNTPEAQREQFRVEVQGPSSNSPTSLEVYVPPGQSRTISIPTTGTQVTRLQLQGDDAPFDNVLQWFPPPREKLQLLYLGTDAGTDPNQSLYYLQRVFTETRLREFQWIQKKPGDPLAFPPSEEIALMVSTSALDDTQAQALRPLVEAGRTLIYALPNAAASRGLATLLGTGAITLQEAPRRNFHLLSQIDFQNPLFASFADSRFNDFTKIHFWKHRHWRPEDLPAQAKVIASFDNDSPAIVEIPLGKGTVLVMTSGWAPADSQLALSTKFVPFLYSVMDRSRPLRTTSAQATVGEAIPLPIASDQPSRTITKPDGTEVKWVGSQFGEANLPGVYLVKDANLKIAVNLPPEESRTSPLGLDPFEKLLLPLAKNPGTTSAPQQEEQRRILAGAELENRQKLWRWLMAAGLCFVIAETWLAGRLARPRAVST
jgi:hypothetical protein